MADIFTSVEIKDSFKLFFLIIPRLITEFWKAKTVF